MDGIKISDIKQLASLGIDLKDVDRKVFNIFSEQIFNTGFVHADPHPGNSNSFHYIFKCSYYTLFLLKYSFEKTKTTKWALCFLTMDCTKP